MTQAQQDTGLQHPETPLTTAGDRNEQAPRALDSPVQKAIAQAKDQLAALHQQRLTTVEGLQTLQAAIEKATLAVNAADSTKLTNLHAKRRSFEERLEELASQEEILTRHLEILAEKERVSTVELHLAARRNAHHEGMAIADRLRQSLGVLEGLYQSWKEWEETDRRLKDTLRSLAPDRMSELPNFSWITAVDQNFQQAIVQVIAERVRAEMELRKRATA